MTMLKPGQYHVISVRYDVYGRQHVTVDDGKEIIMVDSCVKGDIVRLDPVQRKWVKE